MDVRNSSDIDEAAAAWDARLRSPDCSERDRHAFEQWRDSSPQHRSRFEQLQQIVARLRASDGRADVSAMRNAALAPPKHDPWRLYALVASIVLLSVLSALLGSRLYSDDVQVYSTRIGQRSTLTLADGSTVDLNAQTTLEVLFTARQRNVRLSRGEAYFHVAKNPQRPFIVTAADRRVIAVGTAFNVRLDADSMSVTLVEGKVRTEQVGAQAEGEVFLTPGQQLVAKRQDGARALAHPPAAYFLRATDVEKVTGWRAGRVFIDDLSLVDAVAEMNRYSTVQIIVAERLLRNLRVSGMFRAGQQDAFVAALEQYFPILAKRRGDREIVLTVRPAIATQQARVQ
jgi:transmembrane sensor